MKKLILLIALTITSFTFAQSDDLLLTYNHVDRLNTNNKEVMSLNAVTTVEIKGTTMTITLGGKHVYYTILVDTYEYVESEDSDNYIIYEIVNISNGTQHTILILPYAFYLAEDIYYFKFYNN